MKPGPAITAIDLTKIDYNSGTGLAQTISFLYSQELEPESFMLYHRFGAPGVNLV